MATLVLIASARVTPAAGTADIDVVLVTLDAPTSLAVGAVTATTIALSWSQTGTPTGWTLQYDWAGNSFASPVTVDIPFASSSAALGDLASGTSYEFRIRSYTTSDATAHSAWSNTAGGTTAAAPSRVYYDPISDIGNIAWTPSGATLWQSIAKTTRYPTRPANSPLIEFSQDTDCTCDVGCGTLEADTTMLSLLVFSDLGRFTDTPPDPLLASLYVNGSVVGTALSIDIPAGKSTQTAWAFKTFTGSFSEGDTLRIRLVINDLVAANLFPGDVWQTYLMVGAPSAGASIGAVGGIGRLGALRRRRRMF